MLRSEPIYRIPLSVPSVALMSPRVANKRRTSVGTRTRHAPYLRDKVTRFPTRFVSRCSCLAIAPSVRPHWSECPSKNWLVKKQARNHRTMDNWKFPRSPSPPRARNCDLCGLRRWERAGPWSSLGHPAELTIVTGIDQFHLGTAAIVQHAPNKPYRIAILAEDHGIS
ncbi:hypothetical protein J6590_027124 [Homalodisca vitripennis]|nr:hypothetical protein J6590_027124 [Homalodisca vitripennis]